MLKRLRLAWRFKVWPWRVPWQAVAFVSLAPLTAKDIDRTHELAKRYGWKRV
jgi:hypothetical protein